MKVRKEKKVAFNLSLNEYEELKRAAEELDLTVSYFVRRAVERFLKERKAIALSFDSNNGRSKEKKTINFRVSEDVYDELFRISRRNETPVAYLVKFAVKDYVDELESKKKILKEL